MTRRVIRAELEYDGTDFCGWQVQPEVRTVQAEVEKALYLLTREWVRVLASGRTDAGVHALGQVVSFETRSDIPGPQFALGLNRFLPKDVVARRSEEAPAGFHARRSAIGKTYRYTLVVCQGRRPLISRYATLVWPPPDLSEVREALEGLVGEHDFAAFAASGRKPGPTVRRLYEVSLVDRRTESGDPVWELTFHGNGFLYKMVRNLVGTLVEIGQGKLDRDVLRLALETGRRDLCGRTAPPEGLCLIGVDYPKEFEWTVPVGGDC